MNCVAQVRVFTLVLYLSVAYSMLMTFNFVLLSPSCYGLRELLSICESYATIWDIKFNPAKSQVITFDGKNPQASILHLNEAPLFGLKR